MMITSKPSHLYLHVPFCHTICYYCDFCHSIYQKEKADQWLKAIGKEIKGRKVSENLLTIYIGGGTPTSLSSDQLDALLSMLDPYCMHVQEYTVEINPETLDDEKAEILSRHLVNRASIGFQTSDESMLKKLNRHHTVNDVRTAMLLLQKHGIDNISLDLMYSLPDETMEMLQGDVETAVTLQPSHLSLYSLEIHDNTVFGKMNVQHCDEDTEADMYEWICRILPSYGFQQYEISNFSLKGKQSMHNLGYWKYEDFYGIGMGASGKEGMIRYDHPYTLRQYLTDPLKQNDTVLAKRDAMFEQIMMGMRLKEGMDSGEFERRWGEKIEEVYPVTISHLIQEGLIEKNQKRLKATKRGYEILNDVLEEFLP